MNPKATVGFEFYYVDEALEWAFSATEDDAVLRQRMAYAYVAHFAKYGRFRRMSLALAERAIREGV